MLKNILLGLLILVVIMQVFRPEKNLSGDTTKDVSTLHQVPTDVQAILNRACADCHSNKTKYPWYAEIQPVSWWLSDHVNDGKRHFNLNNFGNWRIAMQHHKLEELIEQVKEGEMPLSSYTLIHRDAILSENDKTILINWAEGIMDNLKMNYPKDSLILKREKED